MLVVVLEYETGGATATGRPGRRAFRPRREPALDTGTGVCQTRDIPTPGTESITW
jgi:hypothetical protein